MQLQLADMTLPMPIMLAPMAGVTNPPFRRMCREAAALGYEHATGEKPQATPVYAPLGLYVCEMITSRALVVGSAKTIRMITPDPDEAPKSVQLYGVVPSVMERAAYIVASRGYADHIDLNFGCPVPKVTRKGGGSALPWKTKHFYNIVKAVVRGTRDGFDAYRANHDHPATRLPVTVKIRVGIDDDYQTYMDAGRAAEDAGVDAVIMHGRTLEEHYSGSAHWEPIADLANALDVPVFGNGDIFSADDMTKMMDETGCAGVVVGRGAQGRPWIFTDLVATALGAPLHSQPTLGEVCQMILRHTLLSISHYDDNESFALRDMRKHIGWYLRGFPVGGDIRGQLARVETFEQLTELLGRLDADATYPAASDGPRGRKGRPHTPRLPYGWLESRDIDDAAREILKGAEIDDVG